MLCKHFGCPYIVNQARVSFICHSFGLPRMKLHSKFNTVSMPRRPKWEVSSQMVCVPHRRYVVKLELCGAHQNLFISHLTHVGDSVVGPRRWTQPHPSAGHNGGRLNTSDEPKNTRLEWTATRNFLISLWLMPDAKHQRAHVWAEFCFRDAIRIGQLAQWPEWCWRGYFWIVAGDNWKRLKVREKVLSNAFGL